MQLSFLNVSLLISALLIIVSFWFIFRKAGKPGWYSLIPLWNLVAMLDVAGKSPWWMVFILIASMVFSEMMPEITFGIELTADLIFIILIISVGLISKFNCGLLFSLGIIFVPIIFYLILAFGNQEYEPFEYGYYEDENK